MLIASKLRVSNRAEYLLYMWQVEDLLRANNCDLDCLKTNYLSKFNVPQEQREEMERWYADLIGMMRAEGVVEHGHLQINKNVVIALTDLHNQLLASPKFPYYHAAYYKVLPYIVEMRGKGEKRELPELETCFEMLYGVMLLRVQGKEISEGTQTAVKDVSALLGMLSDYYHKDEEVPLEF